MLNVPTHARMQYFSNSTKINDEEAAKFSF